VKRVAVLSALLAALVAMVAPASAVTHQASVGNYWYEDDAQHNQTKIVVHEGDQITFTVRQPAVPGHTVDVDALNIHSPNLALGQTFTTPRLATPGNFYLYCRPHEQRGHHTRLIVLAAPKSTPARAPKATPHATSAPALVARTTPTPTPAAAPAATLTPIGVGTAPPGSLDRPVPTNPNSLGAMTGRVYNRSTPWTRSLWWLLTASVGIVGAGAFAFSRARFATPEPVTSEPKPAKRKPQKRKPPRKR
jgi:plastocyanin